MVAAVLRYISQFGTLTEWSDQYSARDTGRLTMILYHEAKRRRVNRELSAFRNDEQYRTLVDGRIASLRKYGSHRNVHFVMLESFLDPTLFRNVRYSMSPVHPDFAALVGGSEGFAMSPVFGGKSCQAEFEALCGVPAFSQLDAVEFNLLTGREVQCLPALLAATGYETIASNAFKPDFFNTLQAYTSLGFRQIYFPLEYAPKRHTYLTTGDVAEEAFMFDGALFEQHLAYIREELHRYHRPVINYVLGIYGHNPHTLNKNVRPLVVDVYGAGGAEEKLTDYANQYYYRTAALAQYVRRLTALDPEALIIIVSDHLPPLGGLGIYKQLGYMNGVERAVYYNRLYVIESGGPTRYVDIAHYDIPDLVVNHLTNGEHCRLHPCNFAGPKRPRESYLQSYMGLLAAQIQ